MTKIWKSRFKRYKNSGSHFKSRRERIWLTLNKLNLRNWNNLEFKKIERNSVSRWNYTSWQLNFKSKQEIKTYYGRISESTFKKYKLASRNKLNLYNNLNIYDKFQIKPSKKTTDVSMGIYFKGSKIKPQGGIISWLETRLDVIIFKLNWASSIYQAKQIIRHGNILINNQIITIPSYILSPYDIIKILPKSRKIFKNYVKQKGNKIKEAHNRIYGRVPYPLGNLKYLKGKIEHLLILPLCLEVDYKTMTAILIFNYENEHLMLFHPLKMNISL